MFNLTSVVTLGRIWWGTNVARKLLTREFTFSSSAKARRSENGARTDRIVDGGFHLRTVYGVLSQVTPEATLLYLLNGLDLGLTTRKRLDLLCPI